MAFRKRVLRKKRVLKKRVYKKKSVSLAVKKYVKRSIHANVENKRALVQASFAVGSVNNSSSMYARPLQPYGGFLTINQGTGAGDRIGNKCRTLKAMFRYTLYPLPYDAVSNPIPIPQEVMIIFGFVKNTPTTVPSGALVNLIYQNGNTTSAPQGDLGDLIQPFNTDVWAIKKVIRHKIGTSVNEGSGSQLSRAYYANNDFKYNAVRSINLTSIYPKHLLFNDSTATLQNAGLYCMIQAINANGSTSASATTSIFFDYTLDLTYEDA